MISNEPSKWETLVLALKRLATPALFYRRVELCFSTA